MAYTPISLLVPQYIDGDTGQPYSGAVLKAYEANTTTLLQMATNNTGNTLVDDMVLNADGYPEVSSNIVIPHLNESFKLALYPTQTAADSDTGAVWVIDNLTPTGIGAAQTERVTTVTNLRNYTGQADTVILLGESGATDGSAAIYQKKTGSPASTYTHDGERVILPTGGDGSEAWVRADMDISVKSDVDTHDEDYTLVRNDAGKTLIKTASDTTTRTWTIPLESSVNYPVGTSIRVVNLDDNNLTLVADSTATLRSLDGSTPADGNVTLPEGASGVLYKDGSDTWVFYRIGNVDANSPQTLTNKTIAASQITEISNLTATEGAQLENINAVTISNTQWGYVGGADQDVRTTDTPTFDGAILTDAPQIDMPVSTTSSGGTAGIDYDVADWPGTLVSGRTYYFRAHSTNIARPLIEGMSVVYPGGSIVPPNVIRSGGIYGVRVSGSTLVLTNPSLNIDSYSISSIAGGDDWTRVCRISASTGERCIVKLRFMRNDGVTEMMDAYVVVDDADDKVAITTKVIGDNSRFKHNRIGAYFSGADEVTIYFSSESGSGLFTFVPEIIEYLDADIEIQYFTNQSTGTEAGITGGTFDATSQAARGESDQTLFTTDTVQFDEIELGHASDTTLTRDSAGAVAVEGVTLSRNSTTATHTAQQVELGHASDTTLTRPAAGRMQIEGNEVGVVVYNQALDPGDDFTGNGWFVVIRVGASTYHCTYTALDVWTHSSLSQASSGSIIPATYQPSAGVKMVYHLNGSTSIRQVTVAGGVITTQYRDYSGSFASETTTGAAFSISWIAGGS